MAYDSPYCTMMAQQVMMNLISDDYELASNHEIPLEERVKMKLIRIKDELKRTKMKLLIANNELAAKNEQIDLLCSALAKELAEKIINRAKSD